MRSGEVAVIGRANAGKSTLINVLVGEKVSIVSPKPQTTRDRILAVLNGNDHGGYQIVFVDTPGIYKAQGALNSFMQKTTSSVAKDVDLILFLIDGHEGVKAEDVELLKKYSSQGVKTIVAMTKIDIMPEAEVIMELNKFSGLNLDVIPISARKGKNLKELKKVIINSLPDGEPIFPDDVLSDRSERFMVGEIMREKILLKFDKEIPHGVVVKVNEFKLNDNGVYEVNLDIICSKPQHKAILIGKGGSAIKAVSSYARQDMEKFLGKKVFLTTYVLVKEGWKDTEASIKEYGYYNPDKEF